MHTGLPVVALMPAGVSCPRDAPRKATMLSLVSFATSRVSPEGSRVMNRGVAPPLVVSVENRCDLCVIGHSSALWSLTGDPNNVGLIEVNFRRARLSTRERALADFALTMTRAPAEIEPACLDVLRQAGLTEREILEAAHVAACHNMSNRLVSALGVRPQAEALFAHREPPANAPRPD